MVPAPDQDDVVLPVSYDIKNWSSLDWLSASQKVGNTIEQKGFCIINGFADKKVERLAEKEARSLKRAGHMRRLPKEGTYAHLGPDASAWIMDLAPPAAAEGSKNPPPADQENLHKLDSCLNDVGLAASRSGRGACRQMVGRTTGRVHFSVMAEDRAPPNLMDPKEANDYVALAAKKRIALLYYLGPSAGVIHMIPFEELQHNYTFMTKTPVVIAYSTEACSVQVQTRGLAITVEVDYYMRTYSGPQMSLKDHLPIPKILGDWFRDRFKAIADGDVPVDQIPLEFQREAALTIDNKVPVRIVNVKHELPAMPKFSGGVTPIEATLLGGLDPVTEICKPRHAVEPAERTMWSWGGKWDPDEYYDPDPINASDFKMYTRHYAVLNRNHPHDIDFNFQDFGIVSSEELTMDPRARMLIESHKKVWKMCGDDFYKPNDLDVGFYVGMSGENQFWNFMKQEAKINTFAMRNMSNAAMVARLPYVFKATGPALLIDTEDSSGMAALDTAFNHLRTGRCGPFCFVSSVHWIANPFETILQCAAGVIAKSTRTRVWDESSDGFTKGEGTVCMILEMDDRVKVKKQDSMSFLTQLPKDKYKDDFLAKIVGSGINSKGSASTLSAPSATAFLDCARRVMEDAKKPFTVVDAIESSASGARLADAVEIGFIRKLVASEGGTGGKAMPIPVRPARSNYGNLGPVSGLVSIARSCVLFQKALSGPTLHLNQIMEIATVSESESANDRLLALTEVLEATSFKQLVGVSSFGNTGTNCQMMLWGQRLTILQTARPQRQVGWWPNARVPKQYQGPLDGYYIVGTWSAWQHRIKMEKESDTTWVYTLTMGDNNWECFYIWVDNHEDRCLHPPTPRAVADSEVKGPDKANPDLSWFISGKTETVRMINEAQATRLRVAAEAALESGEKLPEEEHRYVVGYQGDCLPEGLEHIEDPKDMPVVTLNADMAGQPGDKYLIRLHVRGPKHRRVEWMKLDGKAAEAASDEVEPPFVHTYQIIGDHSYWTFQDLEVVEEGVWAIMVQLLKEKSNFQIYRNRDWEQGFYPKEAEASAEAAMQGPDESGHGKNWQISGKVGDRFRVEFRRQIVKGKDERSVRWEFMESGTVDFVEMIKEHRYCYVSSASGFRKVIEMEANEKRTRFRHRMCLGKTGIEYFQIILNGNWLAAVHPSENEASMHDRGVTVEGPDDAGADKYWAIGLHPKDKENLGPREWITVTLEMQNGLPHRVWWERYETKEAHNTRLSWGCKQIFQRHCRTLGFIPFRSRDRPAQVVSKPLFLQADRGIAGRPTMPLSVLAEEEDDEEGPLALPPVPSAE